MTMLARLPFGMIAFSLPRCSAQTLGNQAHSDPFVCPTPFAPCDEDPAACSIPFLLPEPPRDIEGCPIGRLAGKGA